MPANKDLVTMSKQLIRTLYSFGFFWSKVIRKLKERKLEAVYPGEDKKFYRNKIRISL
jgi:hypothetical protein